MSSALPTYEESLWQQEWLAGEHPGCCYRS